MSIRPDYIATPAAFLFDMDGVLVHSTPVHTRAWEVYLERAGLPPDGARGRMLGRHNYELIAGLFGPGLSPAEQHAHSAAKERLYRELMAPVLDRHLVPGLHGFLRRHPEVPAAVASNAERENIDFVLDQGGLRSFFRAVVDGHEIERPKPHPDIYLRAAGMLGASPAECVVFEDSPTGVEAARGAGAKVVGVLTTLDRLAGVDLAIRNFHDPLLERWLAIWPGKR